MSYTKKTICPYDCPASCGLVAETDGTRILKTRGDAEHPVSKGLICRKMQEYQETIHSPERILTPLKRTGEKGKGKFIPITWEEAVSEIAQRWKAILKEDGGAAILPVYFSGVMSVIQRKCGDAFFNRMGACSLVKTLCSTGKGTAYASVMGTTGCLDPRELSDSDFLLIWGSNVKATRIHTMPVLEQARRDKKPVILIEACKADMEPYCDESVLVRPGTDGALALGMMHVLVKEGLTDEAFLRKYAHGYEELKAVLKECTPQWAEKITGVSAETICRLARAYAAAKAPAILLGSGPSRYGNGGMNVRLILILSALTGAWGRPGGGFCGCNPGAGPYVDELRVTRPDLRQGKERKVNINLLGRTLTGDGERTFTEENGAGNEAEPAIRSVYIYAGNPVATVCNQTEIIRGLMRPDLFTVVHERFMTDTARYADIILPATCSVEQTDCYNAYGYCTFGTAYKILPPPGECKSNWDTFCLLARAMGFEDDYFKHTEEEMLEDLLSHPMEGLKHISQEDWRILKEGGAISTGFADHTAFLTETGKMMFVNEHLKDPIPHWQEPYGGEYPLRLVAVPSCYTLNSTFLERKSLTDQRGEMVLLIHPEDAAIRGIQDNDRIIAWNELAEVEFTARVTEDVKQGTAAAPGVYDSSLTGSHLLVNALHHGRLSDLGEATTLNDNTIDIRLLQG